MLQYGFMQNAMIISLLISILCPCIGIFLVLKRHSMIGDTLAHSSLAGVSIGVLFGFNPLLSAFAFTSVCAVLIEVLKNYYKKYAEVILVIVLSLSVGIAITIMSSGKIKSNVNSYLFGSILTVSTQDLITVGILSLITILVLIFFFDKLLYTTFDEEGAQVAGIKVKFINFIFSLLVAATVSVSIRVVGVLVLTSMIALPVATALQFNQGFKKTLFLSVIISVVDILSGLIISYYANCAAGGVISLVSVGMLILVILFKIAFSSVSHKTA
ncbi:metal ABC transporter permease [Clostridium intestinale]|uniref:Metal ABC transporter permease n=1 Tax=Clostridium intestinale TaxID=36845 RepID=A0A7D6VP63_9CLOT|nr:metal ABC transporter permease [Clostridium intestinale]QLY78866.1 metal ABC transporter permease [Clostridium intestinale]